MSQDLTLTQALPGFTTYMSAERRFSPRTRDGYGDSIRYVARIIGNVPLGTITGSHVLQLKTYLHQRHAGESHISNILHALKCLLTYGRDILGIQVLDPFLVKAPKVPQRTVQYLMPEEFEHFVDAIQLHTWMGGARLAGYCFRSLVEVLFATGMRITEALSLNVDSIDWNRKEARVFGKRNKQRTVFFTDRALRWVSAYINLRPKTSPALFISSRGNRLTVDSIERMFQRTARRSGLKKRVSPQIIRHTTATTLLRNGCPIGYIKEVLGHEQLETTCRYYLGVLDKDEAKRAFDRFMS